ncbi:MAG: hypothetical protein LBP53_08190 [Candidatus Peribacteria bacterium]|jgi:uncharacterized HAD superfamily protein|nr:hypothetical protein [Candidatus Peribacteria bacterium]
MLIGIDCDEVLSDTMKQLLQLPFFTAKNIQRKDITAYDLWQISKLGLTKEAAFQIFYELFASDDFRNIPPLPGAKETLQTWKSQGHTLVVITGRVSVFKERTKQWLHQHFPNLFDDILFSNHLTDHEIPKSQLCMQKGIQVMVEDNLEFASDIARHHIPCFLLDQPRNQDYTAEHYPGIIKVVSRNDMDLSLVS